MLASLSLLISISVFCASAIAQTPAAGISANPTTIAAGGSSTLTWTTANAVSADLNGTNVALNGSLVVSPTVTTTYRITAHSSTGATDWGQVTVTVTSGGGPTASITANPTTIASGGSSTLTWSSTNATSATLNGAAVAVSGSQVVSPTATTTYTFIAKSSTGATATSTATVTVGSGGPPMAGLSANPTTIASGGSSTLTWTTSNAVSADLNGTNVALNGSQVVSPTATTTYRLTAHSSTGATDWGQVTVTVTSGGGPTATIKANPTTITSGASSTLTWSSTNATSATLNGAAVAVSGSQVVSPTATTTYTFIAKSSSGATATSTAIVTVGSGGPPTAGLSANPTTIASGGSSTLTWTTTNAVSADLNGTNVALNGSQVVSPTATTTYRITAHSSTGATDWGQVTVTVTSGGGPTATIKANPTTITSGGSSTLTWSSTNATSATLNGAAVAVSGSQVVSPTATTTYTFIAKSSSGATATSTATVTVGSGSPTGQWTPVQTWPYMAAHAHLLPNGKVLFWPSFDIGNNPTLWDPVANTFSAAPLAAYNIFCSGHSFLPDGRLLVTGGHNGSSGYGFPYASIYDPSQNSWTQIPNMQDARWYPTNTTLANGDVLVVAGEITPTTNSTLPQIWHPATNSWINLTSAQLAQPLYPMMFLAPNGQVFNAGPDQTSRYLNTSGTGSWSVVGTFNYSGTRDYGSAVIYDGKVLIAGGDGGGAVASSDLSTNTAEVIDLTASSPAWKSTGSLTYGRRQFNLTLLPDGKVLATGGSGGEGFDNASLPIYAAEMWDPATGKWTTMASISVYRGYHSTALLLPDGRVVSAGGEQTGASAEIYSPPYLFKGARPTITSVSSSTVKVGQTINVTTPDAASISQVTLIRLGSVTHAFDQNQRLNHLQFTQISGGLQVTAPASGNLAPPGHYMLFLVNTNGVPSVARIIQVTN